MIRNHFKIAGRHLLKSKVYSFINIIGLATGTAVVLLIGLWIGDELSFDHYHRDHRMLAQVMSTNTFNGETETDKGVPIPTIRVVPSGTSLRMRIMQKNSRTKSALASWQTFLPCSPSSFPASVCLAWLLL